jgi:hypothetical protein
MKRSITGMLAVLMLGLIFALPQPAVAQASAGAPTPAGAPGAAGSDLILLLDSSASVLPWYREVNDYLVGPFVKDYLRFGDSFHLLTFGDRQQIEVVREIAGEKDVKAVLGRLFLLLPLDRHTDFIGALEWLQGYVAGLPQRRPKTIIIVTDGIQNAAPGTVTAGLEASAATAAVEKASAALRALGWPVHIVMLPFSQDARQAAGAAIQGGTSAAGTTAAGTTAAGTPGPSTTDQSPSAPVAATQGSSGEEGGVVVGQVAATALGASVTDWPATGSGSGATVGLGGNLALPRITFPEDLGTVGRSLTLPLTIKNTGDLRLSIKLEEVTFEGASLGSPEGNVGLDLPPGVTGTIKARLRLPQSVPVGRQSASFGLVFANQLRVAPQEGVVRFELSDSPLAAILSSRWNILALVLAVCFVIGLLFFVILGRVPRSAGAPVADAVKRAALEGESGRKEREMAKDGRASPASNAGRSFESGGIAAKPSEDRDAGAGIAATRRTGAGGGDKAGTPPPQSATEDAGRSRSLVSRSAPGSRAVGRGQAPAGGANSSSEGAKPGGKERRQGTDRSLPRPAYAYSPTVRKIASIMIELRVEGQNSHIGLRNVHELHAGGSKTVGGRRNDYLVFLVPVPRDLGELHYDGEACVFVPRRPELFPALTAPVHDCLGRDIPLVSPRGYPLTLRFTRWEKPADSINRLLHCIEVPGLAFLRGE